jgi:hypothetical protein
VFEIIFMLLQHKSYPGTTGIQRVETQAIKDIRAIIRYTDDLNFRKPPSLSYKFKLSNSSRKIGLKTNTLRTRAVIFSKLYSKMKITFQVFRTQIKTPKDESSNQLSAYLYMFQSFKFYVKICNIAGNKCNFDLCYYAKYFRGCLIFFKFFIH